MDVSESTRIVLDRIQKLEPENASKIAGYILFQDHGEQEIVKLAVAPDHLIHQVILKVKTKLQQLPDRPVLSPLSPSINPAKSLTTFSLPLTFRTPPSHWSAQIVAKNMPLGFSDSSSEPQNEAQFLSLKNQIEHVNSGISGFSNDYYHPDVAMSNFSARGSRKFSSDFESSVKTCHYFNKGFCKHGSSCKFYHDQMIPERFSHMYVNDDNNNNDDHLLSIGSLESEIVKLLKSRRGNPVSIASLPSLYYDTYGKNLQGEGYRTESERHDKTGYSLARLIATFKHIQLIDSRPHGQHAVILKEDFHRYPENRNEKSDPAPTVSGSRQIYLTFPAGSNFTEDDVSNYFNTFGLVEDVRIPCQQHKRMFGFVTFVSEDTVKIILANGNPHYICGARVLAKPYREKSKLVLRKYLDRIEAPVYDSPFYSDMEYELRSLSLSRGYESSRLLMKQLMEEQEQTLEFERRGLAELRPMGKAINNQSHFGSSEDRSDFSTAEPFNYLLDAIKSGSTSDDKPKHTETNDTDQESSLELDLLDSPFGSSIASGNSTVI